LAWSASPFLQHIKENDVYYIHHFKVVHSSLPYRAVDHPCMAMFTEYTEIIKDEHVPDSFPVYAYKISPYEVLRSRENNTALMSDAIGLMLRVSDVKTVTVNGTPRAVRNVYISDGRETAVVALWEAHANQFPAETLQQQMQQGPVVILFVAVTVKLREGIHA
uniref:Replication protein A OB domain-containing protein n=1 Tax=Aegilops tauschii subsp. strangulata TaxID=200361 RepID=A0A453EFT0_AEGTS